ncbi:hypothetical protein HaLaN_12104 [Haematococcus lacustris]|uniref:Uncharacterized protein n=1 Tax=Haematococcus lacustris TaxID=44745 RepID=A0A699YZT2_HAELA|nr:hypothetical protein HaLaN_12104 [Haematococcus lacustris]
MAPASWQQVAVSVSWIAFSGASILINKYIMGLRIVCIEEASRALCGRLPPVALWTCTSPSPLLWRGWAWLSHCAAAPHACASAFHPPSARP